MAKPRTEAGATQPCRFYLQPSRRGGRLSGERRWEAIVLRTEMRGSNTRASSVHVKGTKGRHSGPCPRLRTTRGYSCSAVLGFSWSEEQTEPGDSWWAWGCGGQGTDLRFIQDRGERAVCVGGRRWHVLARGGEAGAGMESVSRVRCGGAGVIIEAIAAPTPTPAPPSAGTAAASPWWGPHGRQ